MSAVDPGGAVFTVVVAAMFIPSALRRWKARTPRPTRRQYTAEQDRANRAVAFAEECLGALTAMTHERDEYRQAHSLAVAQLAASGVEPTVIHDRLALARDDVTLARLEAETWPGGGVA